MEKLCFYEGMGAGQETWGRGMACVGRGLVAGLSCSFSVVWSSSRLMVNSRAFPDATSLSGWMEMFG